MGRVQPSDDKTIQFGVFEVNLRAGELRKRGIKIKLQEQPLQILQILLENPGELITREELQQRIWPADTFVDFDHGLNNAIRRLREALGDSADSPHYIETLARRGYRFIGSLVAATPAPAIPSIAVLPLENLSRDPEQEYFADGLTEALITNLAKIGALRVISRTTAMHYKGVHRPVPEIARELKVDKVVEGTVQRSGDRVRISAQLIDAATDSHVWAESYESDVRDVLGLQARIAKAIAAEIQVQLTPREQAHLAHNRQVNRDAYEAYLKGRYHWYKRTAGGLRKAGEYFEQAIEIDPNYAAAYAGLADTAATALFWGFVPPEQAFARAKAAAQKALLLDETMGEPHAALGFSLQNFDFDFASAEREFRLCIQLSPGYSIGHMWYGGCLGAAARFEESFAEARLAVQLDPLSVIVRWAAAHYFVFGRRYDTAMDYARTAVEIDPNLPMTRMIMGIVSEAHGDDQLAIAEFQEAVRLSGGTPLQLALLSRAYGCAGEMENGHRVLADLRALGKQSYVMPYWLALAYSGLNEKDEALRWLNEGCTNHAAWMTYLGVDPRWDSLRSDSRFHDLLRRMNFPP
ncbi:MAG TPA: winged helix-turn-helix domain-containing protein [Terriglobales bacterium]|jgi:TolB-like protein|nr:winged helix-turn-helix domain-containing protein [Terriglobales bacterium]